MREPASPLSSSYILGELIGRGPYGDVWQATHRGSGARAAIKVLRPELAQDQELVGRLLAARPLLLGLRHPNLVAVRDVVAEGGTLAIVMDLVPGEDLAALLRRTGPLEARAACGLLSGVARALATLHAAGLVHGDIKPETILIASQGAHPGAGAPMMALLTDFALSVVVQAPTARATAPDDLHAFGVVLYEAVTGHRVDHDPPRPDGLPDDVRETITSLLAAEPGSRPSAEEAASQLTALAAVGARLLTIPHPAPRSVSPPPVTEGNRRALVVAIGAAAVLVVAAVVAAVLSRGGAVQPATYRFPVATANGPVRIQRTWTLTQSGAFTEHLGITNASVTTTGAAYDEVIPKSVASNATAVTFRPLPETVVQADPVVRYAFADLRPGASVQVAFTVRLATTGAPGARLAALSADQRQAEQAYAVTLAGTQRTLATLAVAPASLALHLGQVATVTVTGRMSDGSPATGDILAGVTWTSSDQAVAEVAGSMVRALQAGGTTLSAHDGLATASVAVTVQVPAPSPTVRPSPSPSLSPSPSPKPKPKPRPSASPPPPAPPAPSPALRRRTWRSRRASSPP